MDSTQFQDYNRRSPSQVIKDLNEAHTRIKALLRDRDVKDKVIANLNKVIANLRHTHRQHRILLWVQGSALTGCWALVLTLLKIVLHR